MQANQGYTGAVDRTPEDTFATGGLQQQSAGFGAGEVCDPPKVYNPEGAAVKNVNIVQDGNMARVYEPVEVQQTIVQHDIERVKPVLHQEVHQTRLHEVVHHKVEAAVDMGITEVVRHTDADACGNAITGDLNQIRGVSGGVAAVPAAGVAPVAPLGTTSQMSEPGYDNTLTPGGNPSTGYPGATAGAPGTGAGYPADSTYNTTGAPHQKSEANVTGIKKVINKIIPGPGPFTK